MTQGPRGSAGQELPSQDRRDSVFQQALWSPKPGCSHCHPSEYQRSSQGQVPTKRITQSSTHTPAGFSEGGRTLRQLSGRKEG